MSKLLNLKEIESKVSRIMSICEKEFEGDEHGHIESVAMPLYELERGLKQSFKEIEAKDKIIAEQEEKTKELKDNLIVCRTYSNSLNRIIQELKEERANLKDYLSKEGYQLEVIVKNWDRLSEPSTWVELNSVPYTPPNDK